MCCAQLLAMKRSPDDILKLFNSQPHNTLFAGSPAQVRHKIPRYMPDCADCTKAAEPAAAHLRAYSEAAQCKLIAVDPFLSSRTLPDSQDLFFQSGSSNSAAPPPAARSGGFASGAIPPQPMFGSGGGISMPVGGPVGGGGNGMSQGPAAFAGLGAPSAAQPPRSPHQPFDSRFTL